VTVKKKAAWLASFLAGLVISSFWHSWWNLLLPGCVIFAACLVLLYRRYR